MKQTNVAVRTNINFARKNWGQLPTLARTALEELTVRYSLSVALGDVTYIDGNWYVTYAGLLRLASRDHCSGIRVLRLKELCDPLAARWFFKATVYRGSNSKGFVGYGDADPSNVSPLVRGAEMRVAETRAVNRALRKAYGIGLCSVDELSWSPKPSGTSQRNQASSSAGANNGDHNGRPRLRDQLCLLIRQYNLDPTLVKAYAADFCGTQSVKDASRELVESFISHLSSSAKEDLAGLICKLNSYSHPVEVQQ